MDLTPSTTHAGPSYDALWIAKRNGGEVSFTIVENRKKTSTSFKACVVDLKSRDSNGYFLVQLRTSDGAVTLEGRDTNKPDNKAPYVYVKKN